MGAAAPQGGILIVEDNPSNLFILQAMLRKNGYEPLIARDGLEGVAMAEAHQPRLVLMDLSMPRMDGVSAAIEIQRRMPHIPIAIVAVTASVTDEQRRACADAGFCGLLPKPINMPDLMQTVREHMAPPPG